MELPTLYLAGPMTGHPDYNYPAFAEAAEALRAAGYPVLTPAENFDGRTDLSREAYMRLDIHLVLNAEGLAVLPGWQDSTGASLEVAIAGELGLPVETVGAWLEDAS